MLLIDVITAALPALTGHHAKDHQSAYPGVGPHIGVTSFQLAGGMQVSQGRFEYPYWLSFRTKTLGIIGMNAIGLAVARDAFATARANIIYYHAEPVAEIWRLLLA